MNKRQQLTIAYMHGKSFSKKEIITFWNEVTTTYYNDCFSDYIRRDDLPQLKDGQWGLWSPEINEDMVYLVSLGYVQKFEQSNASRTFTYPMYKLTDKGEQAQREASADMEELIRESIWSIRDSLSKK